MKKLTEFGLASNESRWQRIFTLQKDFRDQKIVTVSAASKKYGYRRNTILKWCHDGDIPLWDNEQNRSVVPITKKNKPQWL